MAKRLIDAEDLKARAREEAEAMEEPWHSQFAILVEWLVDKTFTAYDVEKVVEQVRCDCYTMGLDESQTEIIVNSVRNGGVE